GKVEPSFHQSLLPLKIFKLANSDCCIINKKNKRLRLRNLIFNRPGKLDIIYLLNPMEPGLVASCLINAWQISALSSVRCENGAPSTIHPSFKYCFTCFESSSAVAA